MTNELLLMNSMDRELVWFSRHQRQFTEEYNEQFVAIKDEKVIAHGRDFEKVLAEVKGQGRDPAMVLVEFVSKIKRIL